MAAKITFPKGRSLCAALLVGTILGGLGAAVPAAAAERPLLPDGPVLSAGAPSRAAARSIFSLAVTGNQRLEPETVLSYTDLRPGEPYDTERLDRALRDLFDTELFADVAIAGADTGNLVVQVRENPVINRVVLEGNRRLKDDKINPEIRLAPRQIFTRSRARADVARIIELYRRQGRYAASVEPQIVQLDQNSVDIVFEIDEGLRSRVRQVNIIGTERFADVRPTFDRDPDSLTMGVTFKVAETPRVYVERIDISGNASSPDKVVRREFRPAQGDPFDNVRVRRSRDRIQSLGFFQENLEIQQAQTSTPDRVILGVDVEERATGELQLSAGFSSIERFLVQLATRQRNFMGRGQELRAAVNYSSYSKSIELGFTEPYLFDRNIALGFDQFRREWSYFSFSSDHDVARRQDAGGGSVRTGVPLTDELSLALRYGLVLDGPAIGRPLSGDASSSASVDLAGLLNRNVAANGLGISSGGPQISVRPVQVKDSTGNVIRLLDRLDDIPNITADDAIGGRAYYLARAELEMPHGESLRELGLRPSTFVDVGVLWGVRTASLREHFSGESPLPRVTVGYGGNWNSPFGPFRVDIARALLREPGESARRFIYAVGPEDSDEDEYDGPRHGRV